jgi:hypothetical protein
MVELTDNQREYLESRRCDDGTIHFVGDEDFRRQIVAPRMFRANQDRSQPVEGAPVATFVFKEDEQLKQRVQSVAWACLQAAEDTHAKGEVLAEQKREKQKIKDPAIDPAELEVYAGFILARASLIAECEEGIFYVEYFPEQGDDSHCHLVLNGAFEHTLREKYSTASWIGNASKKTFLRHATQAITNVFRARFVPPGAANEDGRYSIGNETPVAMARPNA